MANDEFKFIYLGYIAKSVEAVDETIVEMDDINWVEKGAVQAVKN